jgi:hypothetical protein
MMRAKGGPQWHRDTACNNAGPVWAIREPDVAAAPDAALIDRDKARDELAASSEKPWACQTQTHRLMIADMSPRGGRTFQEGDTGIDSEFVRSPARLSPIRARGTL